MRPNDNNNNNLIYNAHNVEKSRNEMAGRMRHDGMFDDKTTKTNAVRVNG